MRNFLKAELVMMCRGAEYTREMMESVTRHVEALDVEAASKIMEPFLAKVPDDGPAHYDWGLMLLDLYQIARAATALKRASQLIPDDPRPLLEAIKAQQKSYQLAGALEDATKLLKQAQAVVAGELPSSVANRKAKKKRTGKRKGSPLLWPTYGSAAAELEVAQALVIQVQQMLARFHVFLRHVDAAKATEQALGADSSSREMLGMHAAALDMAGRTEEASAAWKAAVAMPIAPSETAEDVTMVVEAQRMYARRVAAGGGAEAVSSGGVVQGAGAAGGWRRTHTAELPCNIRRLKALDGASFQAFADAAEPVILTGLMSDWPAWERWQRNEIVARHGSKVVNVSLRSSLTAQRHMSRKSLTSPMTLADYVHLMRGVSADGATAVGNDTNPPYVLVGGATWAAEDYVNPSLFKPPLFEFGHAKRKSEGLFSLGPTNAGAYFHSHSAAWNGLVYGRKRWFVFPPLTVAFGPDSGLSMAQWVEHVYPRVPVKPLECVQHSGEIMYIPAEWHHGVLNLDESVGVAVQMGQYMGPSIPVGETSVDLSTGIVDTRKCERWCFDQCVVEPVQEQSCQAGCGTHCRLALAGRRRRQLFFTMDRDMDDIEPRVLSDAVSLSQFVRPCARPASHATRAPSRQSCCGDNTCDAAADENGQTCPTDCTAAAGGAVGDTKKTLMMQQSELFGELREPADKEPYHCRNSFDRVGWKVHGHNSRPDFIGSPCGSFSTAHRPSAWLESLVERVRIGNLPFQLADWPVPGAARLRALDLGCGLGQDTRNLARAGFAVTGVDVSAHAVRVARSLSRPTDGHLEFIAHDALALPKPRTPLTFVFDGTVYCSLRARYLSLIYELWYRLLPPLQSPGVSTTMLVQCWFSDLGHHRISDTDMEADFVGGGLRILYKEKCLKNQDYRLLYEGKQHRAPDTREPDAWCYYLRRNEGHQGRQKRSNKRQKRPKSEDL